jgi:predicted nucleic acid-binding Zn ribbon protein
MFGERGNCNVSVEKKQQLTEKQLTILESEMQKRRKNLVLAYVLLIFLGVLGVHKFYLGKNSQGVKYLVLFIATRWVSLPE